MDDGIGTTTPPYACAILGCMAPHRSRVLLEKGQHDALDRLARQTHRSVSDLVREFVDLGLRAQAHGKDRALHALAALDRIRSDVEREHSTLNLDPVAEARADRERQLAP